MAYVFGSGSVLLEWRFKYVGDFGAFIVLHLGFISYKGKVCLKHWGSLSGSDIVYGVF